jgi:probable DNA repair protein
LNPNDRYIAHLETGGLVLAPDLRQARILRRLHDRAQAAAGRRVWATAQVLTLEAWLRQAWEAAADARPDLPVLLPPAALRWLWTQEVGRGAQALLDPSDLADNARDSWLKLRAYGADLASLGRWPLTRDQQAFRSWAGRIEAGLHARSAWDGGDLARLILESAALPPPGPPILLAGFRRTTPVQARLFDALAAAGHAVERPAPAASGAACRQHRARDPESERRAMLAWLRDRVAARPGGLHALIVPALDADRGALERALAACLQPALEVPSAERPQRAFDLAGGHPLLAQPIVDVALAAVAAAVGGVEWQAASRLLLSRHLAGADSERAPRVRAELALREPQSPLRLSPSRLAAVAARAGAPQFAASARAAEATLEGPRRRAAGAWAEAFGACLAAWSWGGGTAPGSEEYQAAQRFGELLRELASLGGVAGEMSAAGALAELRRALAAPFQPESGEPAVFVLDARESLGVHLDSLWVAGLTAAAWPRAAAVDPLLPIEVQRSLGMPCVTPEGCVDEARAIMAAWRAGCGALVLSSSQFENDTEVDATPLMPADAAGLDVPPAPPTREEAVFATRRLEPVPERALPPPHAGRARGGARVLELQAQCPFRAFAELRLPAPPFEEPEGGIDRRLRGIALHRALEALWAGLRDRQALARLDDTARDREVASAVDVALASVVPPAVPPAAIALEREWQRLAVGGLLELDLARPDFSVIETERPLELAVGGLALRLRVDRLDRVGGDCLVIDYKTGRQGAAAWRGARMDAPQLPLYAVLHPERPTGIAFAQAGATAARYLGVGRDPAACPGLKAAEKFELTEGREKGFDWDAVVAHWRAWLEQLAAQFAAGRAEVDPKLGGTTCRRCHLAALCRVERTSPEDEGGEDDDGP